MKMKKMKKMKKKEKGRRDGPIRDTWSDRSSDASSGRRVRDRSWPAQATVCHLDGGVVCGKHRETVSHQRPWAAGHRLLRRNRVFECREPGAAAGPATWQVRFSTVSHHFPSVFIIKMMICTHGSPFAWPGQFSME